jgi:hypothetical protein
MAELYGGITGGGTGAETAPVTAIPGASGDFTLRPKGLAQLRQGIETVRAVFKGLSGDLRGVTTDAERTFGVLSKIAGLAPRLKGLRGGTPATPGAPASSNTTGTFSNPPTPRLTGVQVALGGTGATAGATPGYGQIGTTSLNMGGNFSNPPTGTAPTGTGGGAGMIPGSAVALGALGEIGSQWAGQLNTMMSTLQSAAGSIDVLARQANVAYGGGTAAGTVGAFSKIRSASPQDLASALSTLAAAPALNIGSPRTQSGVTNLMNMLSMMMPTIGATGSAQLLAGLTSGQTLGGPLGGRIIGMGGLVLNPNGGGINSPQQFMRNLVRVLFPALGANPSAAQMRAYAQNGPAMAATFGEGGTASALGLPSQMVPILQAYLGSGGNLSAAEKQIGVSPAASGLSRTSAYTAMGLTAYESSTGVQNVINTTMTGLSSLGEGLVKNIPILGSFGVGAASASASLLGIVAPALEAAAALKAIKALSGLGGVGGGGGAAEEAGLIGGEGTLLGRLGVSGSLSGLLKGGLIGSGLAIGGNLLGGLVSGGQTKGSRALLGGMLSYAGTGAGLGATIGSVVPVLGTGIGAAIGGGLGALTGLARHFLGDPEGSTSTVHLHPLLGTALSRMQAANPQITISSGRRSWAQQAQLYAAKGGYQVAAPGNSLHQEGLAVDVGPASQWNWIAQNATKYGLYTPSQAEPWHLQPLGVGDPEPLNYNPPATQMPANWPQLVLKGLGGNPNYAAGIKLLEAFAQSEHGAAFSWRLHAGAQNNPLDIVAPLGVSGYNQNNGWPVQNYGSPSAGIAATVQFLKGSNYSALDTALRAGKDSYSALSAVPRAGQWGGAGSVSSINAANSGSAPSSVSALASSSSAMKALTSLFGAGSTVAGGHIIPQIPPTTLANDFIARVGGAGQMGPFYIYLPITSVGLSQQDAQHLAQMIFSAIKAEAKTSDVAKG